MYTVYIHVYIVHNVHSIHTCVHVAHVHHVYIVGTAPYIGFEGHAEGIGLEAQEVL